MAQEESNGDASATASPRSTNKLGLSRKEMTDLKVLYKEDKKAWKSQITGIIRDKPDIFGIMDLKGSEEDGLVNNNDFTLHFKNTFDDETVGNIWKELEKTGSNVTIMEVHRWCNDKRRPTTQIEHMKAEPAHNTKWLYKKLKSLTFVDVDDGRVGYLTKDAFLAHFKKEEVNDATALKVFKQIDADHNGSISVKEFITWQNNFNPTEFRSMHQLPDDFMLEEPEDEQEDPGEGPGGGEGPGAEPEVEAKSEVKEEPKPEAKKVDPPKAVEKAKGGASKEEDWGDAILSYRGKQRIWVKAESGKWRECAIISEKRKKIRVHYLSFHRKYDEWVLTSSDRVSQTKPNDTLEEGDVVSSWSNKLKCWIVAEVCSVKKKLNRVQLNLLGTDKQVWLTMDDPRISVSMREPDDPFHG